MSDQDTINAIRADRNTALDVLEDAIDSIDEEIEENPSDVSSLKQLNRRRQNLVDERANIMDVAAVKILSLPSVIAAVKDLNGIAEQMKETAKKLPNATSKLTTISALLSLGQQFADAIVNAQKPKSKSDTKTA